MTLSPVKSHNGTDDLGCERWGYRQRRALEELTVASVRIASAEPESAYSGPSGKRLGLNAGDTRTVVHPSGGENHHSSWLES